MARKRLWRKMSALELAVFESGETVRPLPDNITVSSKNSFGVPMMCFFGTANNAAHWSNLDDFGTQSVIACFDVPARLVSAGHGQYPDLTHNVPALEVLTRFLNRLGDPHTVLVKEYGLAEYSKKLLSLLILALIYIMKTAVNI